MTTVNHKWMEEVNPRIEYRQKVLAPYAVRLAKAEKQLANRLAK